MKVLLLGTAAGGGFPQWNCACRLCRSGLAPRTQDCLAVSPDGHGWYLVNASPDIRAQILSCPALAAGPGPRETPVRGALLTDAELDHTLGLAMLREGDGLQVWAPSAVLEALPLRGLVSRYGAWHWLPVNGTFVIDGLVVKTFPLGDKRPKYASKSTVDGPWVVAYRIEDPATGGVLVYAPCLARWPDGFDELVADAGCVILDGTFYSPGEMSGSVHNGAQSAMGHLPMAESLVRIRRHPKVRWIYTHLNNTNPVLDTCSPEHAEVIALAGILPDGAELEL